MGRASEAMSSARLEEDMKREIKDSAEFYRLIRVLGKEELMRRMVFDFIRV